MADLTAQVRAAARAAGADLVGCAPIARFDDAPRPYHPRTIYPPTQTVIAMAVRQPRGALHAVEQGTYWQSYVCDSYWLLNEVVAPLMLRAVVLLLEEHGYTSVPIHNPFHPHSGRQVREDYPDGPDGMLSLRVLGVACGLGELGRSKLLLTPQFGPRQRVFGILTDAVLEPTPLVEPGTVCDDCGRCAAECEACAIGTGERTELVQVDGRRYAHASFDPAACSVVHQGMDPRFSPFWNGSEAEGQAPSFNRFCRDRFRHLSVCVGRGCLRACLDHLEQTGRIEAEFRAPFMEGERWKLSEPPARS